MVDQRRRRSADVVQMIYKCVVFAGQRSFMLLMGGLYVISSIETPPSLERVYISSPDCVLITNHRWNKIT